MAQISLGKTGLYVEQKGFERFLSREYLSRMQYIFCAKHMMAV